MTDREQIERSIAAGEMAQARAELRRLWKLKPGPASAQFVLGRCTQLTDRAVASLKVALLRSFTVEPLVPLLKAEAALEALDLTVHTGDFNAYAQELLDPASSLYRFAPDVTFLAVATRDVAPELWDGFADLEPEQAAAAVDRVIGGYSQWIASFRARSAGVLVIHLLDTPPAPAHGLLDAQQDGGQMEAIRRINRKLQRLAREHQGVYLLDYEALTARAGKDSWYDEEKWRSVRLPIAGQWLPRLAREWARFLHPLTGRVAKALVVDLDNTLWGGVIAEDGLEKIDVSGGFLALQRAILNLNRRGILLAIASKNNPAEAMEALERHPAMLLRPPHFAAIRLNWQDKAANLRDIARELNIGTDALAFLDDNPVERQWVREQMPEALVIELPENPRDYARCLEDTPYFEQLRLLDEDRERTTMYAGQRMRDELKQTAGTLEDFYHSLDQRVEIAPLSRETLARAAQLTQKTNQFNVTTRRYQEQQLEAMAADPATSVWTVRVADRFGDNGLVGVVITRMEDGDCVIDTFLLSCRVIGRTVETAILSAVVEQARAARARKLIGLFLPTRKNAPARGFFADHGFAPAGGEQEGSRWTLDLAGSGVACPAWIKLSAPQEAIPR